MSWIARRRNKHLLLLLVLSKMGAFSFPLRVFSSSSPMRVPTNSFLIRIQPDHRSISRLISLESRSNENEDDDGQQPQSQSSSPEAPSTSSSFSDIFIGLPAAVAFVCFWPLLALLRAISDNIYNPITGFDIDMFMALKGILDDPRAYSDDQIILELPPLSPAEQLVGAIFGPP